MMINTASKNSVGRALPAVKQTFVQYHVGQCPTYQTYNL